MQYQASQAYLARLTRPPQHCAHRLLPQPTRMPGARLSQHFQPIPCVAASSRGSSTSSPSLAPSIAWLSGELADRRPFSRSLTPSDTRTENRFWSSAKTRTTLLPRPIAAAIALRAERCQARWELFVGSTV